MKKLAFSIFSVLLMLGGIFLSSCCEKNVAMKVSAEEVVIFTNDENAENYQSKQISVNLSNSSSGVRAEVVSGNGNIRVSKVTQKKKGEYVFTIFGDIAGQGQVKVSSQEKPSLNETISVSVKTRISGIIPNSSDGRSTSFLIKGDEGKDLANGDFYDFSPETANVTDVEWQLNDPDGEGLLYFVSDDGQILYYLAQDWTDGQAVEIAHLEGSKIFVEDEKSADGRLAEAKIPTKISVKVLAVYKNDINADISLDVLEKATLESLVLSSQKDGEQTLIDNNNFIGDGYFNLKRNDVDMGTIDGTLVVNSNGNAISILPIVYAVQNGRAVKVENYTKYFNYQPQRPDDNNGIITFNFTFDAFERESSSYTVGDFLVYFNIAYVDYAYDVQTGKVDSLLNNTSNLSIYEQGDDNADIFIQTRYMVKETHLYDANNNLLDADEIDVFSNYLNSSSSLNGFEIRTQLEPSKGALDNDEYYIQLVSGSKDDFRLTYGGKIIDFSSVGSVLQTPQDVHFTNGSSIFLMASESLTSEKQVILDFVSRSNPEATQRVTVHLYKVTTSESLEIENIDGSVDDIDERFINSNRINSLQYKLRVYGLVSLNGLTRLPSRDAIIDFSDLEQIGSGRDAQKGDYIDISFTATLKTINVEDRTIEFYFSHITGKRSEKNYKITTYRPLENVSVLVNDTSSSEIYLNQTQNQNFVLNDDKFSLTSKSLSKLMVEAGTTLSLLTNYQTLDNSNKDAVTFKYLSLESLIANLKDSENLDDDSAMFRAEEIFEETNLNEVFKYENATTKSFGTLFAITENRISVFDSSFKGFVFAYIKGFKEGKSSVTVVRIFALESFYSVNRLSSSVREKLLYTSETLSSLDMNKSILNVSISFRVDSKIPTYLSEDNFEFKSSLGISQIFKDNESGYVDWGNDYYTISDVAVRGRFLQFTIMANSTKWQTVIHDTLTIIYNGPNDFSRSTDIDLEIRNVERVEKIKWTNKTQDGDIYLNLTAPKGSKERSFTIFTNVMPGSANDLGITYQAEGNAFGQLKLNSIADGQSIALSFDDSIEIGGTGYLYLLPNDMVKSNGILLYEYQTEENGELVLDKYMHPIETAHYIKLRDLHDYYDVIINGGEITENGKRVEISNFFINNDGEKIYNKDLIIKIKVVLADGRTQDTAIRIYEENALKNLDTAKHYVVMNNITVSDWEAYENFKGEIFGYDDFVSINFTGNSENFVNVLQSVNGQEHSGEIHNLVFTGNVTTDADFAGYVANINEGKIYDISVDIYYDGKAYNSSKLTATGTQYIGGLVGRNVGLIENSFAYGMSISATNSNYVGGIVGRNEGTISGCGFEFYTFDDNSYNKIDAGNSFGGLAGSATDESVIENSYIYAYPLETDTAIENYKKLITAKSVYLFVAESSAENQNNVNAPIVKESFAFLGKVTANTNTKYIKYINSYLVFANSLNEMKIRFLGTGVAALENSDWLVTDNIYKNNIKYLDQNIWITENVENENFGFVYLKNTRHSESVDIDDLSLRQNSERFLYVNNKNGVLYLYKPDATITDLAEISALERLNTLNKFELFNVNESASKMLIVSSQTSDIKISTTSIKTQKVSTKIFEIEVFAKNNLTKSATFKFIVLNNLPEFSTSVNGREFEDNQTIRLQKGDENMLNVVYTLNTNIYLNGVGYPSQAGISNYTLDYNTLVEGVDTNETDNGEKYISIQNDGTLMKLIGRISHAGNDSTKIYSSVNFIGLNQIGGMSEKTENDDNPEEIYLNIYQNAILKERKRVFDVRVFDGATDLIAKASRLNFKPSQNASFEAILFTDNSEDNLSISIQFGERTWTTENNGENYSRFVLLANKLVLDVSWTQLSEYQDGQIKYSLSIKVPNEYKHLIDQQYTFTVLINAISQLRNNSITKQFTCVINPETINSVKIETYAIEDRHVTNSVLYFSPSSEIINTIIPSSDAMAVVSVRPEYTYMTHFRLTYSLVGAASGNVVITKLVNHSVYGYYLSQDNVSYLSNGVQVDLVDSERLVGGGDYYFRIYASNNLVSNTDDDKIEIILTASYYNGDKILRTVYKKLTVSYLREASVLVGGVDDTQLSSNYLMSKGSVAKVVVTVKENQTANLYLSNQGRDIMLNVENPDGELVGGNRVYTGYITTRVTSTILRTGENGQSFETDNGVFYVCASISQIVNGREDFKLTTAKITLLDFTIDESDPVKIASSGNTVDGYDVLYTYREATTSLSFVYNLLPKAYENYDLTNTEEYNAYTRIMSARNDFQTKNSYKDENANYYINYSNQNGNKTPLLLKEQLYFVTNGVRDANPIYRNGVLRNSNYFNINEDPETHELSITGKTVGRQIMSLETIIQFGDTTRRLFYDFMIEVSTWTDEDTPTPIKTEEEFKAMETNEADDYILMNDIVLHDYTPFANTENIKSLDGNGFVVHIDNFVYPEGNTLQLALFNEVSSNSTLKNVKVNFYRAGQIVANIASGSYNNISVAGFAITNSGIIYNCEVVSYYYNGFTSTVNGNLGINVRYSEGEGNSSDVELTERRGVTSTIAGFVITNNNTGSITNCRVGGSEFLHIENIAGKDYIATTNLDVFNINAQGDVSGFVGTNNGNISACYAANLQITNRMNSNSSHTAGFTMQNSANASIQDCYVEGKKNENEVVYKETNISSKGYIAAFVYANAGLVKNSYANIGIDNSESLPYYVSGFVYENQTGAVVTLCFSACEIVSTDINQLPFSGIRSETSLNSGEISLCYFLSNLNVDSTNETAVSSGVIPISRSNLIKNAENNLFGFSFASGDSEYDGIWKVRQNGITLVSANHIAFSNRYSVIGNNGNEQFFYNTTIRDSKTMRIVNLSYGSVMNPIIIRTAFEFARAMGKATLTEISSYREYYNDNEVFGNYRLVANINFNEESNVDQNPNLSGNSLSDDRATLTTQKKTFRGILDGNGFTISGINLSIDSTNGQSQANVDYYGLFAKLDNAVVMNLDLNITRISATAANVVGALTGMAKDSRIISISVSSTTDENIYVLGSHIVGGVVGMIVGDSHLQGIDIQDIQIYSSDYKSEEEGGKKIQENSAYTGSNMRTILDKGGEIISNVVNGRLNYAGGIAGYVDIYTSKLQVASYSNDLVISDFNVITTKVTGSVNIYGEVAGGLFGYIGNSTMVYDSSLILNASDDYTEPSYIIAKNLYAGGIVGESYGGFFAVQAVYEQGIQKNIENDMHSYYTGGAVNERGQQTIFSFDANIDRTTDVDVNRYDDPYFIGGIAGMMAGGFIYLGYNKLNVVSHSPKTLAVGGIIGFATTNKDYFTLDLGASQVLTINMYLSDIYASGDVYVDGENAIASSGGIIGAMGEAGEIYSNPSIAMKNVLALNYYSYNENGLLGDFNKSEDVADISSSHFILIGNFLQFSDYNLTPKIVESPIANITLLDKGNDQYNVYYSSKATDNVTVGGYQKLRLGDKTIMLDAFGFGWSFGRKTNSFENIGNYIFVAMHIGQDTMTNIGTAHVFFNNYTLNNGWDEVYWIHDEQDLFPHIELMTKDRFIIWDVFNTYDVLKEISENKDASLTIVLRGKLENVEDNEAIYSDIDLTADTIINPANERELISTKITEFKGNLISYREYLQYSEGRDFCLSADNSANGGGKDGDTPGIIINKEMFENIGEGSSIQGINFYLKANIDEKINYTLIESNSGIKNVSFNKIKLVYNNQVEVNSKVMEGGIATYAGLISFRAQSTSFENIDIVLREDSDITISAKETSAETAYLGLLTGEIEQSSSFNSITINNVNVMKDVDVGSPKISFDFGSSTTCYAGLYAGSITKNVEASTGVYSRISVGITPIAKADIYLIGNDDTNSVSLYFGGAVGNLYGVDNVFVNKNENSTSSIDDRFVVKGEFKVKYLIAGMFFGSVNNCGIVSLEGDENQCLNGNISFKKDLEDIQIYSAIIGGVIGEIENASATINTLPIDISIDIKTETGNLGGLIGIAKGDRIAISGNTVVKGSIKEKNGSNVPGSGNIGGFIGYCQTNVVTSVTGTSTINISGGHYVGGMIGKWDSDSGSKRLNLNQSSGNYNYVGDVELSGTAVYFGGILGYADRPNGNQFGRLAFGGSIKLYTYAITSSFYIGGILGAHGDPLEEASSPDGTLSPLLDTFDSCLTYGDVFVKDSTNKYNKLKNYNFGGIVGRIANATIKNCSTMMTDFNTLIATGEGGTVGQHSQAIYGNMITEKGVVFDTENPNYYSSGVQRAYQQENGNIDCYYGDNGREYKYYGYSSLVKPEEITSENKEEIYSTIDILQKFNSFINSKIEKGCKLNPYEFKNDNLQNITIEDEKIKVGEEELGKTHEITWIYFGSDIVRSNPFAETLKDIALIGNGHTVSITDKRIAGGDNASTTIVDGEEIKLKAQNMGAFADKIEGASLVSGFVLDLNVEADINSDAQQFVYGGLTGIMKGNSIIYGVGINGTLSVGGKDTKLLLGGMIGKMEQGVIEECYVDADISYRAGEEGLLYGIAFASEDKRKIIRNSYTSGQLETYTNVNAYTLAYSEDESTNTNLIDVYSISKFKNSNLDNSPAKVNLINADKKEDNSLKYFNTYNNQVLNGSYDLSKLTDEEKKTIKEYDNSLKPISYNGGENGDKIMQAMSLNGNDTSNPTLTPWYFSPYTNNGYATHGFGYLKNVTTYYAKQTLTEIDDDNDHEEIPEDQQHSYSYEYSKIPYEVIFNNGQNINFEYGNENKFEDESVIDTIKDWYLGILNVANFENMVDVMGTPDKNYKFLLRYDLNMKDFSGGESTGDTTKYGKNLGSTSISSDSSKLTSFFVLDGNGHTLDFAFTESTTTTATNGEITTTSHAISNSLFGTVYGEIRNLRLSDINANANATLADTVYGRIENITVTGDLTGDSSKAGVVSTLYGSGFGINAVVNLKSTNRYIVGGVVAKFISIDQTGGDSFKDSYKKYIHENGILSYSSTSGQIISESAGNAGYSFYPLKTAFGTDDFDTEELGLNNITGGVVGYAGGGTTIDHCYNTNAVLSNFTNETNEVQADSAAGGIVGYSYNATISSCYNTGFVGAGNYSSSENYSIAGGIFGYASSGTITNCINDGAVQAINKVEIPKDTTEKSDHSEGSFYYELKQNADKKYICTLTYNLGNRKVYAYGLGFAADGVKGENNSTSTDNIKNDGVIGNLSAEFNFQAKKEDYSSLCGDILPDFIRGRWKAEIGNITMGSIKPQVTGKDSYGFPIRSSMVVDVKLNLTPYDNSLTELGLIGDFLYNVQNTRYSQNANFEKKDWERHLVGKYTYGSEKWTPADAFFESLCFDGKDDSDYEKLTYSNGNWQYKLGQNHKLDNNIFSNDESPYNFYSENWNKDTNPGYLKTDYQDVIDIERFGYEEILKGYNPNNKEYEANFLVTNVSTNSTSTDGSIENSINNKIDNVEQIVNESINNEFKSINVNGKYVSIVNSKSSYMVALSPIRFHCSFHISNEDEITKDEIILEDSNGLMQYYDVEINGTDVTCTLYCIEDENGKEPNISAKIVKKYTQNITLQKGNIVNKDGTYYIVLQDNDEEPLISKEVYEDLAERDNAVRYSMSLLKNADTEYEQETKLFENKVEQIINWNDDNNNILGDKYLGKVGEDESHYGMPYFELDLDAITIQPEGEGRPLTLREYLDKKSISLEEYLKGQTLSIKIETKEKIEFTVTSSLSIDEQSGAIKPSEFYISNSNWLKGLDLNFLKTVNAKDIENIDTMFTEGEGTVKFDLSALEELANIQLAFGGEIAFNENIYNLAVQYIENNWEVTSLSVDSDLQFSIVSEEGKNYLQIENKTTVDNFVDIIKEEFKNNVTVYTYNKSGDLAGGYVELWASSYGILVTRVYDKSLAQKDGLNLENDNLYFTDSFDFGVLNDAKNKEEHYGLEFVKTGFVNLSFKANISISNFNGYININGKHYEGNATVSIDPTETDPQIDYHKYETKIIDGTNITSENNVVINFKNDTDQHSFNIATLEGLESDYSVWKNKKSMTNSTFDGKLDSPYTQTSYFEAVGDNNYAYFYEVYQSGAIQVFYYKVGAEEEESAASPVSYVYIDGDIYKLNKYEPAELNEEGVEVNPACFSYSSGDISQITDKSFEEIFYSYDNAIKVLLAVSGFEGDQIYVRYKGESLKDYDIEISFASEEEGYIEYSNYGWNNYNDNSISLIVDNSLFIFDTEANGGGINVTSNKTLENRRFRVKGGLWQEVNAEDIGSKVIDENTFVGTEYELSYYLSEKIIGISSEQESSGESIKFDYLILNNDISIGNYSPNDINVEIIGNGYCLKYFSNKSVFKNIKKPIKDLNIIGSISLLSEDSSSIGTPFLIANGSKFNSLVNINLYGNLRNISKTSNNFLWKVESDDDSAFTIGQISIKSFVSILSILENYHQSRKLEDIVGLTDKEDVSYTSQNIIIASEGCQGFDNAYIDHLGGDGQGVVLQEKNTINKQIIRVGVGGKSSYEYENYHYNSYSVPKGDDGSITSTNEETEISYKGQKLNVRVIETTLYRKNTKFKINNNLTDSLTKAEADDNNLTPYKLPKQSFLLNIPKNLERIFEAGANVVNGQNKNYAPHYYPGDKAGRSDGIDWLQRLTSAVNRAGRNTEYLGYNIYVNMYVFRWNGFELFGNNEPAHFAYSIFVWSDAPRAFSGEVGGELAEKLEESL